MDSDPSQPEGVSPSSSAEELAQINESSDRDGVGGGSGQDQSDGANNMAPPAHHIHKPEPKTPPTGPTPPSMGVASGASYPPQQPQHQPPGGYAGAKQATPPQQQAPPPGYHPAASEGHYPHGPISLSQPQTAPLPSNPPLGMPSGQMSLSQPYYHNSRLQENPPPSGPPHSHYGGGAYPGRQKSYENVPPYENVSLRPQHLPHPMPPTQGSKYGGGTQASGAGYNPRPGDRSHDGHMMKGHGGPHEYSMGRYGSGGAGARWKSINPASISVAHDAAASGDIATLVSMGF